MQRGPVSCQETGGIVGEVFLNLSLMIILLQPPQETLICRMRIRL
ncbi:unnamed protein product [Linum tenue]|uniref:Uncharacterized protein n=1 Tax=Linum tenue TaxID=586396 RepID=A0AAV0NJ52_9ROSI|nr:unnamed protein product [Linum tenue]